MKSSLSTGRHDENVTHWDDYRLRDSPEINSGQAPESSSPKYVRGRLYGL
ncbi:hypothetical protein [Pleomorphovibrio marinus]|nr:hypothetical protein [Pleomorphovibrio marinus]